MKRTLAVIALAIAALSANSGSTFHPIICTTDACCMNVPFGADTNCCKTDKDPCGIL